MRNNKTKKMAGIAIVIAVEIVLGFISNYVTIGTVSINLGLIAIIIGACIFGPIVGFALGLVNGAICLVAPATLAYFVPVSLWATILVCLLKTGLAGLVSGLVFKAIKNKNELASTIVASIVVPVINTALFIVGAYAFFLEIYSSFLTIISAVITANFLIELVFTIIMSGAIYRIIKVVGKRYKKKEV